MKKIAYCIPTYNRAKTIDSVLPRLLPILCKNDIDIYIYDSSSNDETKKISEKYLSYRNFFYIRLPMETVPIQKIKMIFTGEYQNKKYDYIWLVKDRVYCSDDLAARILDTANSNPDAIFLRAIETAHTYTISDTFYHDPVKLYHDWGWLITSWDVLILSCEHILSKVNWDEILKKYSVKKDISYILVVLLFDTIARKNKCNVPVLDAEAGKHIFNMPIPPKDESVLFDVWGYEWYHTNMNLPDIYNNEKEFVIKSATSLSWIIGDHIRLINLWHDGNLTDQTLASVKDIWDKISDIPWNDVCLIKNADESTIESIFVNLVWNAIENNCMDYVEYYYYNLSWIKSNINSKNLRYTIFAIEIYLSERETNNIHIFDGGQSKEFVFSKIDLVIKLLKVMEKFYESMDIKTATDEIKKCICSRFVSSAMLSYLIIRVCEKPEQIFKKIIDILI